MGLVLLGVPGNRPAARLLALRQPARDRCTGAGPAACASQGGRRQPRAPARRCEQCAGGGARRDPTAEPHEPGANGVAPAQGSERCHAGYPIDARPRRARQGDGYQPRASDRWPQFRRARAFHDSARAPGCNDPVRLTAVHKSPRTSLHRQHGPRTGGCERGLYRRRDRRP